MEDEMGMLLAREDPKLSQQCWSAIVFPLPGSCPCSNKAATHFSDIAMHTLFLENNNTMFKILKERNGWIGVALSFISNASSVK